MKLRNDSLHIQDDLGDILFYAGDGGELMLDTSDLDRSSRGARQRRKQNSSQRVAQGGAVSSLEGFHYILAIGSIFCGVDAFNARLFNFYHIGNTLLVTAIKIAFDSAYR
jgi:hypothetical protein